jgi:hypothetical protein
VEQDRRVGRAPVDARHHVAHRVAVADDHVVIAVGRGPRWRVHARGRRDGVRDGGPIRCVRHAADSSTNPRHVAVGFR